MWVKGVGLVAMTLSAAPLTAAEPAGARAFAERIIAQELGPNADIAGPGFAPLLTARLRAAIKADTAGPEIGNLDYDPLCQCQDPEGLKLRVLSVAGNAAAAAVRLEIRLGRSVNAIILRLANERGGWRLADIASRTQPSLLALLSKR